MKSKVYIEKNYSDIQYVDKNGITFKNGDKIIFADCIGKFCNSATCVAERDITASPHYFEFYTDGKPVRIIFNYKGLFSNHINNKHFTELQMQINNAGYSSYDLS